MLTMYMLGDGGSIQMAKGSHRLAHILDKYQLVQP